MRPQCLLLLIPVSVAAQRASAVRLSDIPLCGTVTKRRNYTGVHTSMAARIEPITPPGLVYCSQSYAAMVKTLCADSMSCTYVGNVPLAKAYGLQKVYHLHRPAVQGSAQ